MGIDDIPKALAWWALASLVVGALWVIAREVVADAVDNALADFGDDDEADDFDTHCDQAEQLANTPLYDALARMNPKAVDAIAAAYAADFDPDLCDWTQRKDRA